MNKNEQLQNALSDIRARLLETNSVEEVELMKAKHGAIIAMMRPVFQHDDDVDESGHHHHEHTSG